MSLADTSLPYVINMTVHTIMMGRDPTNSMLAPQQAFRLDVPTSNGRRRQNLDACIKKHAAAL